MGLPQTPTTLGGVIVQVTALAPTGVVAEALAKAAILAQRTVAGLGNIYSDEALWHARIHPQRPAGTLSADEVAALAGGLAPTSMNAQASPYLPLDDPRLSRRWATGWP